MGLTSYAVLVPAVAAAVLLFVATVWCWPRLAGPGVRPVGARVGLLLATQLALFLSVGLGANRAFGFYSDWSDLLGLENAPGVVAGRTEGGAGAAGPLQVLDAGRVKGVGGGSAAPAGGRVQRVDIAGRASRIASSAYVYLPPEYFQSRYRTRTFPVSVVLTGYPGTARALVDKLHYPRTARKLAETGRMQPMILVMLRPTVAPPRDTECVDVPGGPRTETFFAKDLPDAVAAHYRVAPRPVGWGIVGDSTGGYCALKLALHHPRVYAAGAGLSAYYEAPSDPTTGDLFQGDDALRDRADLRWYVDHMPAPDTSLLVTTSRHGEANYRDTLDFVARVRATHRTGVASIVLDSGGHNFNTWRREIPATLQWLSGRLAAR
ncbi:alpha/beta hydrolase-fold protein [Streptomyces sp. NPDC008150]|uniref:alpha/beta hydrolase n=1 Tax=Streptomyces sp. NPDC008150 TaxID=3364816 RepID=UPI0036E12D04